MIYLQLFFEFFLIGLFTFGGGYAMIPLVREMVLENGWLTESQFYDFIGVCESTPGPIAINMATFVGSDQAGILGSACATLGVVLPSFIIILIIAMVSGKFLKNKYVQRALNGIKAVVPNSPVHFFGWERPTTQVAHSVGADTRSILERFGYSSDDISSLIDRGIALENK